MSAATSFDLSVQLGRLTLPNPVLVASGTFGYAREMESFVDLASLGGMIPKTITPQPRQGNAPWRTVESAAGLLNSIGLDNDGLEGFLTHHLPYLTKIGCPVIVSLAASNAEEFVAMATRLQEAGGVDALELNISCPNVSGGVDFGTDPDKCHAVLSMVVQAVTLPVIAKLTPNVTDIAAIAVAAESAGVDAISAINTVQAMVIDWRRRRPLLGKNLGGLSGPAIKPIALRCIHQIAKRVKVPIIGIGGISTVDDAMEFLVAGASAVQVGTANFYDPTATTKILAALPGALAELNATSWQDVIGTLELNE